MTPLFGQPGEDLGIMCHVVETEQLAVEKICHLVHHLRFNDSTWSGLWFQYLSGVTFVLMSVMSLSSKLNSLNRAQRPTGYSVQMCSNGFSRASKDHLNQLQR